MSLIHLKSLGADRWAEHLAEPTRHWRTGFSARTLAHCWQDSRGFPHEVQAALDRCQDLQGLELLIAIPEHQVPLPGGGRPSQSDVWALARTGRELVSVAVEGKVAEPFGPTLDEWKVEASPGKKERLRFLFGALGLREDINGSIRYQLLHRTVAPLLEAKRFHANSALMLVHSFSQCHQWFEDYAAFASLLGVRPEVNTISPAGQRSGVNLYIGWVCGDSTFLSR